jgi:hypothetical protein
MKASQIVGFLSLSLALTASAYTLPALAPLAAPQPPATSNQLGRGLLLRYRYLHDTELPQLLAWLRDWGLFIQPLPGQRPANAAPWCSPASSRRAFAHPALQRILPAGYSLYSGVEPQILAADAAAGRILPRAANIAFLSFAHLLKKHHGPLPRKQGAVVVKANWQKDFSLCAWHYFLSLCCCAKAIRSAPRRGPAGASRPSAARYRRRWGS